MDHMNLQNVELNVAQLFIKSMDTYKARFSLFLAFSLCASIVNEIIMIFLNNFNVQNLSVAFVSNILISCIATVLIIDISSHVYLKKNRELKDALAVLRNRYWRFVAVSLATIFLFGLGLLFLVVPGVILMVFFIFTDVLVILENAQLQDAFRNSFLMVKPHFWKVFLFVLVILGVSSIPGLLVQYSDAGQSKILITLSKVLSVLIMPFFVISQVILYHSVRKLKVIENA